MSALIITILTNIVLAISLLYVIFRPKVIKYYSDKKKQREIQEVKRIQSIVNDYLRQLQND
jgi:hypothetical protein